MIPASCKSVKISPGTYRTGMRPTHFGELGTCMYMHAVINTRTSHILESCHDAKEIKVGLVHTRTYCTWNISVDSIITTQQPGMTYLIQSLNTTISRCATLSIIIITVNIARIWEDGKLIVIRPNSSLTVRDANDCVHGN